MEYPWSEDALWQAILEHQSEQFYTATGLPFTYTVKRGRTGSYNKELIIDRRENSKTLTWGSLRLAFAACCENRGRIVEKPKALGDIRGISYIYPILWRFGYLSAPEKFAERMEGIGIQEEFPT